MNAETKTPKQKGGHPAGPGIVIIDETLNCDWQGIVRHHWELKSDFQTIIAQAERPVGAEPLAGPREDESPN